MFRDQEVYKAGSQKNKIGNKAIGNKMDNKTGAKGKGLGTKNKIENKAIGNKVDDKTGA